MLIKQKLIGIIIIIAGALPFLLKITTINNLFNNYKFLSLIMPGEVGYQILIIVLGVLLIISLRPKIEHN